MFYVFIVNKLMVCLKNCHDWYSIKYVIFQKIFIYKFRLKKLYRILLFLFKFDDFYLHNNVHSIIKNVFDYWMYCFTIIKKKKIEKFSFDYLFYIKIRCEWCDPIILLMFTLFLWFRWITIIILFWIFQQSYNRF